MRQEVIDTKRFLDGLPPGIRPLSFGGGLLVRIYGSPKESVIIAALTLLASESGEQAAFMLGD
jgi:hypothetical protein